MDYQKHYNLLIARAQERVFECYTEKHHIVPKCMGGSNKRNNLVNLLPEEHYLAHLLLVKMYPDVNGLVYAAHIMSCLGGNKRYGWLKRKHAEMLSETRSGVNHPMYGRKGTMLGKKHTKQARKKMSESWSLDKRDMRKPTGKNSPNYGKKHTKESIARMCKPKPEGFGNRMSGENNPNYGKNHTKTTREKMKQQWTKRSKVECVHCGYIGYKQHITRYHNNNCKNKVV